MLNIWNTVWPILVAILVFCIIIIIHELGHFLFAKLFKIRVNEFALGMGPTLFKFQKGETKYAIRLLPIGGFCAMEGEDENSEDPRAFFRAKVWKRIIVVAAGAVFNIILGFALMLAVVGLQPQLASTTVGGFYETSTSNLDGGFMVDDRIVEINGRAIFTADDISYMLATDEDGEISAQVIREGKRVKLDSVKFAMQEQNGRSFIILDFKVYPIENNIGATISEGFKRTVSMGRMVWMSLGDMISGKYGLNDISGPVGVTQIVSDAVSGITTNGIDGLIYLLRILCLITVNLGVFNLLPIPALDGSRILFLIIEGIRRKPVPRDKEAMVHSIGMILLLIFMAVIIFKDLWVWIFK